MKKLAILACSALLLSGASAAASGVSLQYGVIDLQEPISKMLWSDSIPEVQPFAGGRVAPFAAIGKFTPEGGGEMIFSMLFSSYHCSASSCPYKVSTPKGEILYEGRICDLRETHKVNPSGSILFACDNAYFIGRPE